MIDLKSIAGGIVVAGSLGLALGFGAGAAQAAPTPVTPEVQSTSQIGQGADQTPGAVAPSPYAAYGGDGICATPGLYFVNICT